MQTNKIEFSVSGGAEEKIFSTVSADFDGKLIKDFLKYGMNLSSTLIKKVKYGGVFLGSTAVTMRALVHTNDKVTVRLPKEESEGIEPILIPLRIAYEDDYMLVVDKPLNMPVHPSKGNSLPTLANAVMAYMGKDFVFRAVNRLDRDTEGLVIIAKNQYAAALLSEQMKAGNFEKYYTAVLCRIPAVKEGIIDAPIAREREGEMKRVVRDDGKRAVTEYKVTDILSDGRCICNIRLHTGRTHQIRVHMAHIGAPLYADFLYGERQEGETYSLKASTLVLRHPVTYELLEIKIPR